MPRAKKQPWRCKGWREDLHRRCPNPAGDDGYCPECRQKHWPTGPKTAAGKKKVSQNAVKHGIYRKAWTKEEKRMAEEIRSMRGRLEHELDDTRIRRWRILKMLTQLEDGTWDGFADTDIEVEREGVQDENGQQIFGRGVKVKRKRKRVDLVTLYSLLDRFTARIASLERRIQELKGRASVDDPYEIARQIREAVQAMNSFTGGEMGDAGFDSIVTDDADDEQA